MIYKGKLVELYSKLFDHINQDIQFYKYFIEKNNGIALEIGSGTGRLLLNYLSLGYKVEGIEPNEDMSKICLKKAKLLNLKPHIYQQKLHDLNLNKKYKTIYMPLFVFQNIIGTDDIIKALKNSYDHLDNSGQILISIFPPWNDPTGTWEQTLRISNVINDHNETIVLYESVSFDQFEQIQTKYLKHEIFQDGLLIETYFSETKFRCYSLFELTMLLKQSGFNDIEVLGDYALQGATSSSQIFVFSAFK